MNKTEDKIKAELKAISFMPDAKEIREYYLEDFNLLNAIEKNRQIQEGKSLRERLKYALDNFRPLQEIHVDDNSKELNGDEND